MDVLLLLVAGLAAGFLGGLIGVGGGIVFTPVLFFYFEGLGVVAAVHTPLTLGTSLLCTLVVALASGFFQYRQGAVVGRVALIVGATSAVAVFATTRFVTTQPWYDDTVFQIAFGLTLLVVAVRMALRSPAGEVGTGRPATWPRLAATGTAAGAVATAVGVGGGVVLVPVYHHTLGLPMRQTVGTSSATIALIALSAVAAYILAGWDAPVPAGALGYVDVGRALLLAAPAVPAARLGVWAAHRVPTRALRVVFAVLGIVVAARMLFRALG